MFHAATGRRWAIFCAMIVGLTATATSGASEAFKLSNLAEGDAKVSFRYRYEFVDEEGFAKSAHASTLRTRLTYQSPEKYDVGLVLEADNVLRIGGALYSDGNRTVAGYPVVADPQGTEINQAFLRLRPSTKSEALLGRQRIALGDLRIVGNVGWRQNEQTYDAVSAKTELAGNTRVNYAYLWNINRIFGPDGGAQAADWSCQCHLLHVSGKLRRGPAFSLFAYELDLEDAASLSNRTVGFRIDGDRTLSPKHTVSYLLSVAHQTDTGSNAVDYDASYFHGALGFKQGSIKAKAGIEILRGDSLNPGSQFVTPLATLHAYNGWADKFLATPVAGLEDRYLSIEFPVASVTLTAVWHDFVANDGDADYGREWDISVSKAFESGLAMLAKMADYTSDGFATDTNKFWLMLSYSP